MKRSDFNNLTIILVALLLSTSLAAGQNISRTFTWKYNINKDARVVMQNYDCNLTIHSWDKGEAEFHMTIEAEARSADDASALEKYVQGLVFSNSSSSAEFRTNFWKSRNTILNRTTMELPTGKSIALKTFEIRAELWIPSASSFSLDSKYSRVSMEDFAGKLVLDLYNSNLTAGNIAAALVLTDKYSTIVFGDTRDLRASLYNSKLNAENTGDIDIDSKYSGVKLSSCGKMSVNSYNDKYEAGKTGDVTFTAKYSDLKTGLSGAVNLDLYNGTVTMEDLKDVKITSKYGEGHFSKAGSCTMQSSYNDKFTFSSMNSLSIGESKYSSFDLGYLAASLDDRDSYNDSFDIMGTGKEFSRLQLNGKYSSATLVLPKSLSYRLKADIQYADLKIDESLLKPVVKIVDGNQTKYDAVKGTETEGMPVIEVNGYQVTLKISDR